MAFLDKIFHRENANETMRPLYDAIVSEGRRVEWYERGGVPDSLDGRFDMIAAILSLVLLRLERDNDVKRESAWLTELFVTDMDGQLRQIGIGDMIVGKHIGRMMGALGGRIGAYREGLKDANGLGDALVRNLYRGEDVDPEALDFVKSRLLELFEKLEAMTTADIIAGKIPEYSL